jgi:hypothetical protein
MLTTTPEFDAAVAESHRLASQVTVEGSELPIADGSVTLDETSATRASVSLTLALDESDLDLLVPDTPDSLLAPYGNELKVYSGVRRLAPGASPGGELLPSPDLYPSPDLLPGSGDPDWENVNFEYVEEMVPLGIYRLDETETDDRGDLGITVTGYDRSAIIIDAVFEMAGEAPIGTLATDLILGLLRDGWRTEPPAYEALELADESAWDEIPTTLPAVYWEQGEDRWDFCQGIAEAANCNLYFDVYGQLVLRRKTISQTPSLTISEGEGGVLLGASKRWGRADACNRVVAIGSNTSGDDPPLVGIAVDANPFSPTYYYKEGPGAFGRVTFSWSTEFLPDPDVSSADWQNQIDDVARNILEQKLGTGQQISFDALVNPALEPLDTILIQRDRMKITSELHIVDSLTIPLGLEGSMTGSTRVKQVDYEIPPSPPVIP